MDFRITGLSPAPFERFYGLSDAKLRVLNIVRYTVDETPGFPDRIEMREGRIGETMLLLNHIYQPANSPYKASHAVFVLEGATHKFDEINTIPEVMQHRILSLRAFDANGMMISADLAEGPKVEPLIQTQIALPNTAYIHAHNAKQGCYSGLIERAY